MRRSWTLGVAIASLAAAAAWWGLFRRTVDVESLVIEGERLLSQGKPDDSAARMEAALRAAPDHAGARWLAGRVQLQSGRPADAAAHFARIPRNDRLFGRAQFPLAKALIQDGQWDEAERVLSARVREAPEDTDATEELRWLWFNLFRTTEVLELLDRRLSRGDFSALPELLDSEYHAQVANEAEAYLEPAWARHPNQGLVAAALGICRWRTGRAREGRDLLLRAVELRPADGRIRRTCAELLLEQGDVDAAERLLNGDTDGSPGKTDLGENVNSNRAADAVKSNDVASRERSGREIATDEEFAESLALRARIDERRRDYSSALEKIGRAIERNPHRRELLTRRGALLRAIGKAEEAAAASRRAAALGEAERRLRKAMEEGAHRDPTPENCRTMAALCRAVGKTNQANAWNLLAERLEAQTRFGRP